MFPQETANSARLVGRDAPQRRVATVLGALGRGRGGALVISGEPGIGKTALLGYAMREARHCTVLSAVGLESESQLPFVALGDALRPLLPLLGELPPLQATALRTALALEIAELPVARYAVCMATLTLLTVAAEGKPVLVLTDDAHWLDPASAVVLSFAARRLANDPVAVLFTVRDGLVGALDTRGLEHVPLTGLGAIDSGRMVEQLRGSAVAAHVSGRLWQATRGNPLALREMAARLDEQQLAGARPLPETLPLGADLTRAFTDHLQPLPEDTRTALLVLALAAAPEVPVLVAALEALGLQSGVLDPADAAGLIVIDGDRVRFSHPLVRSAVESAAGGWARRRAYEALITSAEGDARLRYRAAAATGPDDELANELEATADRMRVRSGLAAAARVMYRTAQLSSDPERRARRLLQAASDALNGGQLDDATAWLDHARTLMRLDGPGSDPVWSPAEVPLPEPVPPRSNADFRVLVTAPPSPGSYRMAWTLLAGDEVLVGPTPVRSVQVADGRCVHLRTNIANLADQISQLQELLTGAVGAERASIIGSIKGLQGDLLEMKQEARSQDCPQ